MHLVRGVPKTRLVVLLTASVLSLVSFVGSVELTVVDLRKNQVEKQLEQYRVMTTLRTLLILSEGLYEGRQLTGDERKELGDQLGYLQRHLTSMASTQQSKRNTAYRLETLAGGFFALITSLLALTIMTSHLDDVAPGINFTHNHRRGDLLPFLQYSIVTLTSLGTTDIQPTSSLARMIACAASIIGIIYLLAIVGIAVSLAVS